VAVENLVPIGDLPFELAALAEPMGCVLNGIDVVGTDGVEDALVFGAGPIGMLAALALRTRGVGSVGMVDVDESRIQLAKSFELKGYVAGSDALAARRRSVDLVVDATGVPAVVADLTSYAADGGKVLILGVCPPDTRIEISPFEIFRRQLTVAGAHSMNHNVPAALETIRSIGPGIGRLITHKVPLSEIPSFLLGTAGRSTLKVQAMP
jgi:threonine dehydrogenase-like Zn-dependent dehydrogenase